MGCEHMLLHEVGILPPSDTDDARRSAVAMFMSFLLFGFVPIVSYIMVAVLLGEDGVAQYGFIATCGVSMFALFALGFMKNKITESSSYLLGGVQMMFQGAVAGSISYYIGSYSGYGQLA